jgi:hypothetical protein
LDIETGAGNGARFLLLPRLCSGIQSARRKHSRIEIRII